MKTECFVPYIPRRLWAFNGKHWVLTGDWAWMKPTFRVVTFWNEVYYVSPEHMYSSKPFSPQTTPPQPEGEQP